MWLRASLVGLLMWGGAVQAESRQDVVGRCFSSFAAGDRAAHARVTARIRDWGDIADPALRAVAEACLALDATLLAAPDAQTGETVAAQTTPTGASPFYRNMLARIDANPNVIATEIATLNRNAITSGLDEPTRVALETAILAYVRPLPAARAEDNLAGYRALALIRPEDTAYTAKVNSYTAAIERRATEAEARAARTVRALRKHTAEFDGSAWYRHPKSPRYQDTRPYLTLYVLEDRGGKRELEFFVNYTADSWLFVRSAELNIDGDFVKLPSRRWGRDNDTEIWEWTRYVADDKLIDLARRIANSKRTVIRFNGDRFYDDYVIPSSDKTVLRDMLEAWDVMKPG